MKLTNPFFLLAVIVLFVGGIMFATRKTETPRLLQVESVAGTTSTVTIQPEAEIGNLATAIADIEARTREWNDTARLALSTSRISLAPIVHDLQSQLRANEKVQFPKCMQAGRDFWLEWQRQSIDGFIGFMADSGDAALTGHIEAAARAKRNYGMVLDACRPTK